MLEPTGAQFVPLDAATHDQITGVVSHLPHVIATSLVRQVKGYSAQNHLVTEMAAGGFRDITRIASSNPHMWRDILKQNRSMLLTLLDDWMKEMEQVKLLVEKVTVTNYLITFQMPKNFVIRFTHKRRDIL
ncbi:prephenate dehydrogenase dimerization domain-containing protein [Priestia megaterium]